MLIILTLLSNFGKKNINMNLKNTLILPALVLLLTSCSNDSTDDLTQPPPVDQIVTFNSNIKAIIQNNCIYCHGDVPSNGAPMSLVTYENVKTAVLERNLIGRISTENGQPGLMPNGGPRLPQSTIDLVIKWQSEGFQE